MCPMKPRFLFSSSRFRVVRFCVVIAFGLAVLVPGALPVLGQGIGLRAVSAVNESMAGAATGCPLDAAGALNWNPASISGLNSSEMSFSMGLILPQTELGSHVGPLTGWDCGEPGVIPVPSMAFVHQVENSPWSYGLGIYGIGGSTVNYSSDPANPILRPQTSAVMPGLGRLSANVDVVQMAPTISYKLTEHLSFGIAPTITMAKLYASPLFLGSKNPDATWSSGVGTRYAWGGGVQAGLYYTTDSNWHYGASLKSPQWVESFRYKSETNTGLPRTIIFDLDYPLVASVGMAYSGFDKWVFAMDARYFDYANTPGFELSGFNADGSAMGVGWNSIASLCFGVERQISDCLFLRGGYSVNENPIPSDSVQYNVASPLIIQHSIHSGLSYVFAENWMATLAYVHCFENQATGPLHNAAGPVAGTWVSSKASADEVSLGITKRF
jgi:long-chain fatty acid transport protein